MGSRSFRYRCRVITVFMVLITSFFLTSYITAYAEEFQYIIPGGNKTYSYMELETWYEINSITYMRNKISYQIEALSGDIASENYESLNHQYITLQQKIVELNNTRKQLVEYKNSLLLMEDKVDETELDIESSMRTDIDTELGNNSTGEYDNTTEIGELIQEIDTQIAAIDIQLKQYTDSKYTTSTSVSSAKLQDETQAFYNKYQQVLINESQIRLKDEFLKKCFGLIVIKEQTDYYIAYQQYLSLLSSVETIKYKMGYVTKNKLDTVKLDISKNDNMLLSSFNQYENARDYIDNETNISKNATLQLKMDMKEKSYDENITISRFKANNTSYMKIQHYLQSYQNYQNSGSFSYSTYKQILILIKDYQLQLNEFDANVKSYVKGAIQSYQYAFKVKAEAREELNLKIEKCSIVQKKYDNKKATLLDVYQANVERESAEIAYYKSCYEVIVWENILDNCIFRGTV